MKKLMISIAFCLLTVATYAQSVELGIGGNDGNVPLYGHARIGLPIVYQFVKVEPFGSFQTFPAQRIKAYYNPYFKDVYIFGLNAEIKYAYFRYTRNMSARSYQQRHTDYGRTVEYMPNLKDTNTIEVGFRFTLKTIDLN
jgi:hypothetical protein